MSGHSKWAQIKRQKGVADIKRGQAFTKLANAIIIAVRDGGGITNPEQNFKLRLAIEKARASNMPKDNIERAIDKGAGKGENADNLQQVVYEGFFGGNVAVIVEAVTDNRQRTTSEIKNIFDKSGASMGVPGAVSYLFETKGIIVVTKNGSKSTDELFLLAADSGAEDVEEGSDEYIIYTKPDELSKVKETLSSAIPVASAELIKKPVVFQTIKNDDMAEKLFTFLEKLESLDDVQKVYSNFQIQNETTN